MSQAYKILTLGNCGAGKTSLLHQYAHSQFNKEYDTTIGMDVMYKSEPVGDETVKVHIWDTAGQERFRTITQNFYRGAHAIIFIYDVRDHMSQHSIGEWEKDVKMFMKDEDMADLVRVVVGNKVDLLESQEQIEQAKTRLQTIEREFNMDASFLTSAKQNISVQEAFKCAISKAHERMIQGGPQRMRDSIILQFPNRKKTCCL